MKEIVTKTFVGNRREIPGTSTGWNYQLSIIETETDQFMITLNTIPGNPANSRTTTKECIRRADGVFVWTNERIIDPTICVETFISLIPAYQPELQKTAYSAHIAAFIEEYKIAQENAPEPTTEQIFEMTAAFGPNKTVVNVITGKQYRTLKG